MAWEIKAPAVRPHGSQFAFGLRGACTLLAMAACKAITARTEVTPAGLQMVMKAIYDLARKYGLCAPNGAANQRGMLDVAQRLGMAVRKVLWFSDPMPEAAWIDFLHTYVANGTPYPLLVQLANGQALRDAETGAQDERGLQFHAICIYGTQTDPANPGAGGYICADGDNPDAVAHPAIYSLATLRAAQPVSMIAFDYAPVPTPKPPPPPVKPPAPPPAPVNDGDIDLPPNVAADLQKQLAAALAAMNEVAAALNAAKHTS